MVNCTGMLSWVLALGIFSVGPVSALADAASKLQATGTELEGVWEGQSAAEEGRSHDLKPGQTRLTFRASLLSAIGFIGGPNPTEEKKMAFKINSSASPKTIDIVQSHQSTIEGIYEVTNDELRLALPSKSTKRPTSFAASPGSGMIVLTLKRSAKH